MYLDGLDAIDRQIVQMLIENARASYSEIGEATGGEPGDQTGREIWVRPYYDYPWDGVLRLKTYVA